MAAYSALRRALSLSALVALTMGFAQRAHAEQTNTLNVGYQKYGTLVLLKAQGTLEKRLAPLGIQVKWAEFPGGPQLLEALNAGSVDLGVTGETPPIFAQAAGADLVYIANEPAAPEGEGIVVKNNSPIKSLKDLKGKRVALNKGSNVHYLLVKALENAGLKYSDITPVFLNPADGRAAFENGSVDAWAIWDPFFAAAQKQLDARSIADGRHNVSNHQFYLASKTYADQHAKVLKIVIEELAKLDSWSKSHLGAVTSELSSQIGLDPAIVQVAAKRTSFGVQVLSPQVIAEQQRIADSFYALKLIPQKLQVSQIVWQPRH